MEIKHFSEKLVYGRWSLSHYITNIDVEYDRNKRCTERNVFYAGIFCTFLADDANRSVATKESTRRAFDAFQINNPSIFNTLIYELLEDKDSVIRTFYGFLSEEEAQILLEKEGQWLLRMDKDGFIITEATSINDDGSASVTNYRLIYEGGNFHLIGTTNIFPKLAHITEIFPMEVAHCSSPYFAVAYSGHPTYFGQGDNSDSAPVYLWDQMMKEVKGDGEPWGIFRCVLWGLKIAKAQNPLNFLSRCAQTACLSGTVDQTINVLKQALKLGVSLNGDNPKEKSPIESLAQSWEITGNFEELRNFLWSNGFDPNTRAEGNYPVLWYAAANRYWGEKIVTLWTDHPDLDINIRTSNGHGHVLLWSPDRIPNAVLNHPKIDMNVCSSAGHTIIDHAIDHQMPFEKLRKFIKLGADAKKRTSKNRTYLHAWIDFNVKETNSETISQVVQLFLEHGINIDDMNGDGLSALHVAAQSATIEIVKVLVENGANIHGHPDSETTPLHLAAERGDVSLVQYLLARGADVTKRNSAGQLPKDVAALSAKELFETAASLPPLKFTCKYLPVEISDQKHSLPFPRYNAQCMFIGEYFYIWGGQACFSDWWDEYGYVSLQNMDHAVRSFWRTKIGKVPLVWENIPVSNGLTDRYGSAVTCAAVERTIWFNAKEGEKYEIYDPRKNTWSETPPLKTTHKFLIEKYFFDFGDRLVYPTTGSLGVYDKAKNSLESFSVDEGDINIKYLFPSHFMVYLKNAFWVKNGSSIFTMSPTKKRWLKSTTIDSTWTFASSIIGFGNRFLLAVVRKATKECNLFVLDTETGLSSYHQTTFNYTDFVQHEPDLRELSEERTLSTWRTNEPEIYENANAAVVQEISEGNFPFSSATLSVFGKTLVIFGGERNQVWQTSDILTLNLTPLLPYLSLEQLAGISAAENSSLYSAEKLRGLPDALQSKFNLYN